MCAVLCAVLCCVPCYVLWPLLPLRGLLVVQVVGLLVCEAAGLYLALRLALAGLGRRPVAAHRVNELAARQAFYAWSKQWPTRGYQQRLHIAIPKLLR